MKKFKVITLDARYSGYGKFKYAVDFWVYAGVMQGVEFINCRAWCWDTYGPGIEVDHTEWFGFANYNQPRWGWKFNPKTARQKDMKLYLQDDAMLSHFLLTHSS